MLESMSVNRALTGSFSDFCFEVKTGLDMLVIHSPAKPCINTKCNTEIYRNNEQKSTNYDSSSYLDFSAEGE